MRLIIVTGTNTGVGKTVVTAALASCALTARRSVAVVKPLQTGVSAGEIGDLQEVTRLSAATDRHEYLRLPEPLAPATAARRAGVQVPGTARLAARIAELADRDLVVVEGAGGLLVELNQDGQTLLDLALELQRFAAVEVLLVASAGLGVLNLVALTARALDAAGVGLGGVVLGDWPSDPDLAARCNVLDLPRYAGADLVGAVPAGSGRLDRDSFAGVARASLSPRYDGTFDASAFVARTAPAAPLQEVHA